MVFLNMQKAFDTVNHEILLSILQCVGFSGTAVKWFTSYFTGRTHDSGLWCGRDTSDPEHITCGAPQGSILGPLLFLVYINNMLAAVTCGLLYMLWLCLTRPGEWWNREYSWQRALNTSGKTESMFFGTKRKLSKLNAQKLMCYGTEIVQSRVTYLGLTLEQSLTCKSIASKY